MAWNGTAILVEGIQTAEAFIEKLSPHGPWFGPMNNLDRWVFRGQKSFRWDMVPSVLRPETRVRPNGVWIESGRIEQYGDMVRAEYSLLREYFYRADSIGLTLPEDSQAFRLDALVDFGFDLEDQSHSRTIEWPNDSWGSFMGLAQHYGIPTRLIDWSRNAYSAAYFAARELAEDYKKNKCSETDRLAVFALNTEKMLESDRLIHRRIFQPIGWGLGIITAPRAGNPFLHAQHGLFTIFRQRETGHFDKIDRRSLPLQIRDMPEAMRPDISEVTLPASEAPKLLRLLAKEGWTAASIYPGYRGAALALKEEEYWDK